MLNHKLDFSSCAWKPGFVKSSHICVSILYLIYPITETCIMAAYSSCGLVVIAGYEYSFGPTNA